MREGTGTQSDSEKIPTTEGLAGVLRDVEQGLEKMIAKAKYQLEIEQNLLLIKSRLIHLYNYVDNKTPILEI